MSLIEDGKYTSVPLSWASCSVISTTLGWAIHPSPAQTLQPGGKRRHRGACGTV